MSLLTSILRRQIVPSPSGRAFPVDFALEYFRCQKDDEHFARRRGIFVPPFACRFNKNALGGHMLGIADEDGWVQILDTRKRGQKSIVKEWHAHENAVFDIGWMEGEQMLVTASGDQTIRLWDVNRDDCLALFKGHSCSVKSVDFREDDIFVFASGARDGSVMVWDMRCNRRSGHFNEPVNIIYNAHTVKSPGTPQTTKKKTRRPSTAKPALGTGQQSVTAVLFQGGKKLISSGAMDGQIKIWDLRKTYTNMKQDPLPFHVFPNPGQGIRKHGISSLVLDSTHSRLFAGCTDDNIYMYSCTALGEKPLGTFSGHHNSTFYVKTALSPNDMYLLSGSSGNDGYIWSVTDPSTPPILLKGHLGEVTSVAWCPADQGKIVTCSDDNTFRVWRIDLQASTNDNADFIGSSTRACPDKITCQSPASPSVSLPLSPGSPVSQGTSPKTMTPRFESPKQLLTSWLRTNSRKRTHSDSDNNKDHLNNEKKTDAESGLTPKVTSAEGLAKNILHEKLNMGIQVDRGKENHFMEQKSPEVTPLRKRLRTNEPLHVNTSNNQESNCKKLGLNTVKEICSVNHGSSGEIEQDEDICKQTLSETQGQVTTADSKCQISPRTKPKNWLMEWSAYYKAKYKNENVRLPDRQSESKGKETVHTTNNTTEQETSDSHPFS